MLSEDLFRHAANDGFLFLQLGDVPDEGNHHLGVYIDPLFCHLTRRFKNGPCLHLGNFGKHDPKTAAAVAEHRVKLP